jgi:hypothetical protein
MAKAAHHRGGYQVQARRVTLAAYADPSTQCWRCGKTLNQHAPHKDGTPARWTAGHLVDGAAGGDLAPEASVCNYSAGATAGNRKRNAPIEHLRW